jgi:hypothetical protein
MKKAIQEEMSSDAQLESHDVLRLSRLVSKACDVWLRKRGLAVEPSDWTSMGRRRRKAG